LSATKEEACKEDNDNYTFPAIFIIEIILHLQKHAG